MFLESFGHFGLPLLIFWNIQRYFYTLISNINSFYKLFSYKVWCERKFQKCLFAFFPKVLHGSDLCGCGSVLAHPSSSHTGLALHTTSSFSPSRYLIMGAKWCQHTVQSAYVNELPSSGSSFQHAICYRSTTGACSQPTQLLEAKLNLKPRNGWWSNSGTTPLLLFKNSTSVAMAAHVVQQSKTKSNVAAGY